MALASELLLYTNFASSTLAGPIAPTSTSLTVASGTGAVFPTPGANQYFLGTLTDAATGLVREIVSVTARAIDTFTIGARGLEGTSALSWQAGDVFGNLLTAGTMGAFLQVPQAQASSANLGTNTGTGNAMIASLNPAPLSLAAIAGAPFMLAVGGATNSGNVTLNLNSLGAQPVLTPTGAQLPASTLPTSFIQLCWAGAAFILLSRTD